MRIEYALSVSGIQRAERGFNYDGVDYTAGAEARAEIDITEDRSRSAVNYDVRLNGFTLTFAYAF